MIIRAVSYPASRTDLDADLWTRSSLAAGDVMLHGRTPSSCSACEEVTSFRMDVSPPHFGHGLFIFSLDGGSMWQTVLSVKTKPALPAILIFRLMMPHTPFVVSPSGGFSGPNGRTTNELHPCQRQNENCCWRSFLLEIQRQSRYRLSVKDEGTVERSEPCRKRSPKSVSS